jgi:hypothetical protein
MLLEILVSIFVLFAISRSILRLRAGSESLKEFFLWIVVWIGALLIAWFPTITAIPAVILNVERGIDVIIYVSIVALFYSVYRIYSKIEMIEQEITALTRYLAIDKIKRKKLITRKKIQKTKERKR